MGQNSYIFRQLCQCLEQDHFEMLVKRYDGNKGIRSFSCWNFLLAMVWSHLTNRKSLRDIEISLRSHSDKLYRMGIGKGVSKSNMAYSLANRNVDIFREHAAFMMECASHVSPKCHELAEIAAEFNMNGFFAIDSSTIYLDLDKYPWSTPQAGKGGMKLHTMYDLLRQVPAMAIITGHERRDQSLMDDYEYRQGCLYTFDKAYVKTNSLYRINHTGAWFVVRLKDHMRYDVLDDNTLPEGMRGAVRSDRNIRFAGQIASRNYPDTLRLVDFHSEENDMDLKFLTNNVNLPALTIALAYKHRWDIEVFFKWMKQHLHIEAFYGTSPNAVMIQLFTAIISFCMLVLVADYNNFKGTPFDLSRLLSTTLLERASLVDVMSRLDGMNELVPVASTVPSLFDQPNVTYKL